jgi:K+-transporting ATPase KdpF subunit
MIVSEAIALILAIVLLVYMLCALLKPEWFS